MNYKGVLIFICIILIVGFVSYKIIAFMKKMETNTVSPQCSENINFSKKIIFSWRNIRLMAIMSKMQPGLNMFGKIPL